MTNFINFEDIDAWKKSRILCDKTFQMIITTDLEKDFGLRDQVNRSSGSVMDNIAEGFERGVKREFIQFLFIAKASNSEFRSQLYIILDRKYINKDKFEELYNLSSEIGKMIGGLINYLKKTKIQSRKFTK